MANMQTTPTAIHNTLTAFSDQTISVESLAMAVIALSLDYIGNADISDKTHRRDTPGVDSFFWALWDGVYQLAAEGDDRAQERIVQFLKLVRGSEEGAEWVVRDAKGGWKTLPLLGDVARDIWNGPNIPYPASDKDPAVQAILAGDPIRPNSPLDLSGVAQARNTYLNLQRFAARLWHDIHVDFVPALAIDVMRLGLEAGDDDRNISMDYVPADHDSGDDADPEDAMTLDDVDQASDGNSDDEDYNPDDDLINELSLDAEDDSDRTRTPRDLEIEAAAIWVTIAGEDMFRLGKVENGSLYSVQRWAGWKAAFKRAADNGEGQRKGVVAAAKAAAEAMDVVEQYVK